VPASKEAQSLSGGGFAAASFVVKQEEGLANGRKLHLNSGKE
jgi:hypothetical protein